MRKPISAEERLAVTLRYMATGETMESLMYQYRIHSTTLGLFIQPVCRAIFHVLAPQYIKCPDSEQEWSKLADKTWERWQFLNGYLAVDGKHVGVICPAHSGSDYYNYKGFFSVVLMAFVDFDYHFVIAEAGTQGKISDGGVYRSNEFNKALQSGSLNIPPPRPLPRNSDPF